MSTAQECVGMLSRVDDHPEFSVRSWIACVDLAARLMKVKTEVTEKGDNRKHTYNQTLHWLDKSEMEHLLVECGFRVAHIYGDWDMRSFSNGDHRMIFAADRNPSVRAS